MTEIRTRFAPSPTGFLHVGGARTALFSYAFAKHHHGKFILRIEDTDVERSTPESVQAILDGMDWLGLDYDEGPFYQMQRLDEYKLMIQKLLTEGNAYYCYMSKEELETLRHEQEINKQAIRYNGFWRDNPQTPPKDISPVIRFKNPLSGSVTWSDAVKGIITINNSELDDFIIARSDGTPTYNFCVVVDDWQMNITHVIRGDDHINNTPKQINLLTALGANTPIYAHVPMILGSDGSRLSKRHGAVSVTQYQKEGYLPEAVNNFLARLGWGHGDEEIFSQQQFIEWFGLDHLSHSPAQFNEEKLKWLNHHYIQQSTIERLISLLADEYQNMPRLAEKVICVRERAHTIIELESWLNLFKFNEINNIDNFNNLNVINWGDISQPEQIATIQNAFKILITRLEQELTTDELWQPTNINGIIKTLLKEVGLKMPQLAMPIRQILTGQTQTPAVDHVMWAFGRSHALDILKNY